ncbi:Sodium/hydrogen exchanger, partial [Conidiobolus coronatus NRRL 28638]
MTSIHLNLHDYHTLPALERLFISDTLVALIFGVIVGPYCLNLFDPTKFENQETILLEFSRIVIAIQVMAIGVSMPKKYIWIEKLSIAMLLLPVMLFMWLISGGIIKLFLPSLTYLECLLIAACVTPTDPILANSVVKGRFAEKNVPINVRDILSAESGINDGLGLPYLFLALYLLSSNSVGQAIADWVLFTWLYMILLSIVIGAIIGWLAKRLVFYAEQHDLIDKESFLGFWIGLALFLMGSVATIGSDELLACFVAGTVFAWNDWFSKETREAHLQEVVDMIFNYSFFIYFGTTIPWASYSNPELGLSPGKLVGMAAMMLFLRRLPPIIIFSKFIPAFKNIRQTLFAGWFGPIGVGAIYLSLMGIEEGHKMGIPEGPLKYMYTVNSFLVLTSIIVHGITIPLFYLGYKIPTRTLTQSVMIQNMVSRLPVLHRGDQLELDADGHIRGAISAPVTPVNEETLNTSSNNISTNNLSVNNLTVNSHTAASLGIKSALKRR